MLFQDLNPLFVRFGAEFFKSVPKSPGVYLFKNSLGDVLYVGKAKNLRARINSYKNARPNTVSRKVLRMLRLAQTIEFRLCEDEKNALLTENQLLRELRPPFNIVNTYPETYYFITLKISPLPAQERRLVRFQLTTNPTMRDDADERYGVFKGRGITRKAFAALLRLIAALEANEDGFYFPTALTRYKPPYLYALPIPVAVLTSLKKFLAGSSRRFLDELVEKLLGNENIPRFIHHVISEDLATLSEFFEFGPKRVYKLKRSHGIRKRVIAQREIDDLIVMSIKFDSP